VEAELKPKFSHLVGLLEQKVPSLSEAVVRRVAAEFPDWIGQPDMREAARVLTTDSIRAEVAALGQGSLPKACPPVDAEGARTGARAGAPLDLLLRGYRVGHAVQWKAWFDLVEQGEMDGPDRRALLEHGSQFFFDYADRVSGFTTEEFMRERDRNLRSLEQRRMHLVRELLQGGDVDAAALGYDIALHHIGVVARGLAAQDVVRDLARTMRRRLLLVEVIEDTWWAWIGGERALERRKLEALGRFGAPSGAQIGIGSEAPGPDGFRTTHMRALSAQRAGLASGAAVTRYDDIALEALAARDEGEARSFVARELRGIDGDDLRSRRLRETLHAYFAAGQNAAATAAALRVHEQTVGQRLRAVEDRIGHTVPSRRAELEVALRLRRYLKPPSGRAGAP
jgi:hypothetical protein